MRLLLFVPLILVLVGCAGKPVFETSRVATEVTPARVVAQPAPNLNKIVLWGGLILNTHNREQATQIEILAYPLNSSQRPALDQAPQGRFIIEHAGYLEAVTYAQGRQLTVLGKVGATRPGKVGDSDYLYPVIEAEQLKLWPESSYGSKPRTTFHLGIGVRL